ncbi:MAG: DUF4262 domain-containing protein [Actinomycetota bacterium]
MDREPLFVDWEARIDRWGFTNVAVSGGDEPDYVYTAGLFHLAHPEFVIVGAPRQLAHEFLWDLASAVARSGRRFEHGMAVNRLAVDPMGIVTADRRPDDLVAVADRLRERAGFDGPSDVLQVIFSDDDGELPWGRPVDHLGLPIFTHPGPVTVVEVDLPDRATRDADGWYPEDPPA